MPPFGTRSVPTLSIAPTNVTTPVMIGPVAYRVPIIQAVTTTSWIKKSHSLFGLPG